MATTIYCSYFTAGPMKSNNSFIYCICSCQLPGREGLNRSCPSLSVPAQAQQEARCNKHEGEIRRLAAATAVTLLLTSGSTRRLSSQVGAIICHMTSPETLLLLLSSLKRREDKRREQLFNLSTGSSSDYQGSGKNTISCWKIICSFNSVAPFLFSVSL